MPGRRDRPAADLSAGVFEYPQLRRADRREEVDFAVVGSGPGGAVIARELAVAGRSVAVLEEGPFFRPETYRGNALELMRDLFSERGLRAAFGNVTIPTMQAKALGGNSVVNSAICWRAPRLAVRQLAVGVRDRRAVAGNARAVLRPRANDWRRSVPTRNAVLGRKGELFHRGCAAVRRGRPPDQPRDQGLPGMFGMHVRLSQGRQTEHGTLLHPRRRPARRPVLHLLPGGRSAGRTRSRGRRARVRARARAPVKRVGQVTVRAKATILAAGVMASPLILLKNRLP